MIHDKKTKTNNNSNEIWINPTGGYGDILMLSGVLKKCVDLNPNLKYNLVRRAIYTDLFKEHPAIKKIGYPPKDAHIITTDYWAKEKLGKGIHRPYQILGRLFGLQTPVEENLYLPAMSYEGKYIYDFIPFNGREAVIMAPSSVSPRKTMDPMIWQELAEKLTNNGFFVIQVGRGNDTYIKGTYSLLGLTSVRQLVFLISKSKLIISIDNFVMHVAHLTRTPAIIVWGPTESKIYGYPEQIHFQCPTDHCDFQNKCLGPSFSENYRTSCPIGPRHCMNSVPVDRIINYVLNN